MKNLFSVLFLFFAMSIFGQTIIPSGSANQGTKFLGGIWVDGPFVLPVQNGDPIKPNFPFVGRMRVDPVTLLPMYCNGSQWFAFSFGGEGGGQNIQQTLEIGGVGSIPGNISLSSNIDNRVLGLEMIDNTALSLYKQNENGGAGFEMNVDVPGIKVFDTFDNVGLYAGSEFLINQDLQYVYKKYVDDAIAFVGTPTLQETIIEGPVVDYNNTRISFADASQNVLEKIATNTTTADQIHSAKTTQYADATGSNILSRSAVTSTDGSASFIESNFRASTGNYNVSIGPDTFNVHGGEISMQVFNPTNGEEKGIYMEYQDNIANTYPGVLIKDTADHLGLMGEEYFGSTLNDNAYAQQKFVTDALAGTVKTESEFSQVITGGLVLPGSTSGVQVSILESAVSVINPTTRSILRPTTLRFYDNVNGNHYIGFQTPGVAITEDMDITIPNASGTLALVNQLSVNDTSSLTTRAVEPLGLVTYFSYTGSDPATWSIPFVSGTNTSKRFVFIGTGTGTLTLTSIGNEIWQSGVLTNTISVLSGGVLNMYNNGTSWIVIP